MPRLAAPAQPRKQGRACREADPSLQSDERTQGRSRGRGGRTGPAPTLALGRHVIYVWYGSRKICLLLWNVILQASFLKVFLGTSSLHPSMKGVPVGIHLGWFLGWVSLGGVSVRYSCEVSYVEASFTGILG